MVGNYNLSQSTHSQNCFLQGCSGGPGFQGGARGKEPSCQCRRHKRYVFDPCVRKIPVEEGMATDSSILGGGHGNPLQYTWRRAWQPTPVYLPGESNGQRSLGGYSPWVHKELNITKHKHLISSSQYSDRVDARKIQGRGRHLRPKKYFLLEKTPKGTETSLKKVQTLSRIFWKYSQQILSRHQYCLNANKYCF